MKNKIISCLLLLTMLVSSTALAVDVKVLPYDFANEKATIQVTLDSEAKGTGTILLANPDVDVEDLTNGEGAFSHFGKFTTDDKGYIEYSFGVNRDENGFYTIHLSNTAAEKQIYIPDDAAIEEKIGANVPASLTNAQVNDYIKVFSLLTLDAVTQVDDKQVIAEAIIANKDTALTADAMQRVIIDAALVDMFEKGKTNLIYKTDYSFTTDAELTGITEMTDNTFYTVYDKFLSKTGRQAVAEDILGGEYEDLADLKEAFGKSVFLNALNSENVKTLGGGHITSVLTEDNAEFAGLTDTQVAVIKKYAKHTKINAINDDLCVEKIESVSELITTLEALIKKYSGGGGGGGGGADSSDKETVVTNKDSADLEGPYASALIPPSAVGTSSLFNDVLKNYWGLNAIESLSEKGIISGYPDKTFRPEDLVSREQTLKMLCVTFGIEGTGFANNFNDVDANEWYYPYVASAVSKGAINGIGNGVFGIGMNISREDFAVIFHRLMGAPKASATAAFDDIANVSAYAVDAVSYMKEAGIIAGYEDNTFKPAANLTRAEAATIIFNYLKTK